MSNFRWYFLDRFPLHSKNILKENATMEEVLLEYSARDNPDDFGWSTVHSGEHITIGIQKSTRASAFFASPTAIPTWSSTSPLRDEILFRLCWRSSGSKLFHRMVTIGNSESRRAPMFSLNPIHFSARLQCLRLLRGSGCTNQSSKT